MPGNLALPAVLAPLAGLGIDITRQLQEILNEVNRRLEEQYNFSRPKTLPNLWPGAFFEHLDDRTINGQQYIWERGNLKGMWYRIRVNGHFPMMPYFLWAPYDSEEQAREHWRSFIALVEAREGIPALIRGGDQRPNTGPPAIKIRCRQCQSLNDESAKFCNQCGSAI